MTWSLAVELGKTQAERDRLQSELSETKAQYDADWKRQSDQMKQLNAKIATYEKWSAADNKEWRQYHMELARWKGSRKEQASAGLDQLTDEERARFTELNDAYKARFGFPFIMAVKGRSKGEIMDAFERRIAHDRTQEFSTALTEISRIALLRLGDMLPG